MLEQNPYCDALTLLPQGIVFNLPSKPEYCSFSLSRELANEQAGVGLNAKIKCRVPLSPIVESL